jgi:hypothetical protein
MSGEIAKICSMVLLLSVDLAMNCTFDYDDYGTAGNDFLFVLLITQIIIQISIFFLLFVTMADTYVFRIGLLGVLLKKFRLMLITYPIYLGLTIAVGAYRIRKLGSDYDLIALWYDPIFVFLTTIQKTCK